MLLQGAGRVISCSQRCLWLAVGGLGRLLTVEDRAGIVTGLKVGWSLRRTAADPFLRARVLGDLGRGRSPRAIAGRLAAEAADPALPVARGSVPVHGRTVSHEAVYALPRAELVKHSVVGSRRTRRR